MAGGQGSVQVVQQPERRISDQKLRVKGLNYTCVVIADFKPETEKRLS